MPRFPQADLTLQFISTSYQNVVQIFDISSDVYFLDGLGNIILGIPTGSIGNNIVTQDQTINSASYALTSSYSYESQFSNDALYSVISQYSSQSFTASYIQGNEVDGPVSHSVSSSYALTSSYSVNSITSALSQNSNNAYGVVNNSGVLISSNPGNVTISSNIINLQSTAALSVNSPIFAPYGIYYNSSGSNNIDTLPTNYNGLNTTVYTAGSYLISGQTPSFTITDATVNQPIVSIGNDFTNAGGVPYWAGQLAIVGMPSTQSMQNVGGLHFVNYGITGSGIDQRSFVLRVKSVSGSYNGAYTLFENRYNTGAPDQDTTFANWLGCNQYGNVFIGDCGFISDSTGLYPNAKVSIYGSPSGNYPVFQVIPGGYNSTVSCFTINSSGQISSSFITASVLSSSYSNTSSYFYPYNNSSSKLFLQSTDGYTYPVTLTTDGTTVALTVGQIPVTGTNGFINIGTVLTQNVTTISSSYTASIYDYTILCIITSSIGIYLSSSLQTGQIYNIKNYNNSASSMITIQPQFGTIDGSSSIVVTGAYKNMEIQNVGSGNWAIL